MKKILNNKLTNLLQPIRKYFDNCKTSVRHSSKIWKINGKTFSRDHGVQKHVFWKKIDSKIIILLIKSTDFEVKYVLAVFKRKGRNHKIIFHKSWESSTARSNMDYAIYQIRKSLDNILAKF